jgi:hypothetical protein
MSQLRKQLACLIAVGIAILIMTSVPLLQQKKAGQFIMAAREALSLNCEYTAICDSELLKTSPSITKAHVAELPHLAGGKHGLALNQILRDFRKTPISLLDVESEVDIVHMTKILLNSM